MKKSSYLGSIFQQCTFAYRRCLRAVIVVGRRYPLEFLKSWVLVYYWTRRYWTIAVSEKNQPPIWLFFPSEISLLHNAFKNGIFQPIFYSRTIFLVLVKKGKKAHLELLLVMWHGCQIILAHKDVVLAIKDEAFASLLQQQQRLCDAHCPKKFLKMQIFQF